jgi:hypothetical protein
MSVTLKIIWQNFLRDIWHIGPAPCLPNKELFGRAKSHTSFLAPISMWKFPIFWRPFSTLFGV